MSERRLAFNEGCTYEKDFIGFDILPVIACIIEKLPYNKGFIPDKEWCSTRIDLTNMAQKNIYSFCESYSHKKCTKVRAALGWWMVIAEDSAELWKYMLSIGIKVNHDNI